MKKIASVVLCAVLFAAVPVLVSADEVAKKAGATSQQMKGKETGANQEKMGKCEKCGEMKDKCCCKGMHRMGGMMKPGTIVATTDGGVVVMKCHKLLKYDADLNLVKTTEIQMEEKEMGEECPKCEKSEENEK